MQGKGERFVLLVFAIQAREVEDQVFEEVLSFLDDPERQLRLTGLDREETHA